MTFDANFAFRTCLPLSAAAYELPLKKGVMPDGYQIVAPIRIDGSSTNLLPKVGSIRNWTQYGYMFHNAAENIMIAAFRGTSDFDDTVKDCEVRNEHYKPVPWYGDVHQGFQNVYFAIRDSVITCCNAYKGKFGRLILTGHSLGGALSTLAAPDMYYQRIARPEVINFASPRVGKSDFAAEFNKDIITCFRVVNKWDDVPRVPATWSGYRHVGEEIKINGGFTLDALHAHSLNDSYYPGVAKLIG